MNDLQDDVRELLSRKAEEMPPHLEFPGSLARRAHRRVALNALVACTTVLLVALGAIAGLRTLRTSGSAVPASGSTASATGTRAGAAAACTSDQLRAEATMQGAMGSREGTIALANVSGGTCTLQGRPDISLLDQGGSLVTSGVTFVDAQPGWQIRGSEPPPGWPVVTLDPGDGAVLRIRWGNWCPRGRPTPRWVIAMPGSGHVEVAGFDETSTPPCSGADESSTIEVGPFEPEATGVTKHDRADGLG